MQVPAAVGFFVWILNGLQESSRSSLFAERRRDIRGRGWLGMLASSNTEFEWAALVFGAMSLMHHGNTVLTPVRLQPQ